MKSDQRSTVVKDQLVAYGESITREALFPTLVPEAALLATTDPFAFSIAACLDRGTKAEVIWTIPYYIKRELGHLEPYRVYPMSLDQLAALFRRLPRRPRYVDAAPRTIHELTRIVVEKCEGDASNLWKKRRAAEVKGTFRSIYGVGEGIANMTVLLIERCFRLRFDDLDHRSMDIKPDVHTMRVLYRLGVSEAETTNSAIAAARLLNPAFPGGIDPALWIIGRDFCSASNPKCDNCPMAEVCARRVA